MTSPLIAIVGVPMPLAPGATGVFSVIAVTNPEYSPSFTHESIPVTPDAGGDREDLLVGEAGRALLRLVREHRLHERHRRGAVGRGDAVHRVRGARRVLGALRRTVEDRDRVDVQGDRAVVDQALDRLAVRLLELVADRAHEVDVGVHRLVAVTDRDRTGLGVDARRGRA